MATHASREHVRWHFWISVSSLFPLQSQSPLKRAQLLSPRALPLLHLFLLLFPYVLFFLNPFGCERFRPFAKQTIADVLPTFCRDSGWWWRGSSNGSSSSSSVGASHTSILDLFNGWVLVRTPAPAHKLKSFQSLSEMYGASLPSAGKMGIVLF